MAEYIKREAAIREIEQINPVDYGAMWDYEAHHWAGECLRDCKEVIDSIPAADMASVVRCKDCVHWDDDPDTYGADYGPKGKCMKSFETMRADDFCSYGERKENNHEKV